MKDRLAMGGGLSVRNNTNHEVLVVLSQAGPLYSEVVRPGERITIDCGKVWFTVTASVYTGEKPSGWEVAKPFVLGFATPVLIVAGVVLRVAPAVPAIVQTLVDIGTPVATGIGGAIFSNLNSRSEPVVVFPASETGVYADGKTITVTCKKMAHGRERLVLYGC